MYRNVPTSQCQADDGTLADWGFLCKPYLWDTSSTWRTRHRSTQGMPEYTSFVTNQDSFVSPTSGSYRDGVCTGSGDPLSTIISNPTPSACCTTTTTTLLFNFFLGTTLLFNQAQGTLIQYEPISPMCYPSDLLRAICPQLIQYKPIPPMCYLSDLPRAIC